MRYLRGFRKRAFFLPNNATILNNNTIIRVVAFGALAVFGIIAFQTYWVSKTWNLRETEFHENVVIGLQNVADRFQDLGTSVPTFDLVKRVSSNYYVVNINDEINANNLQYFLRTELEKTGLTQDFEYGIYNCATNEMVYGDYIGYNAEVDTTKIERELPIYDEYIYYFGVRFPNYRNEIISNLGITLASSIILLVTIAFFLYSLNVILRQKKLSEMQKDFINNMTHEFKTPISTIKISADTFLKDKSIQQNERLSRYASIIKEQNQRLNQQVEKVLQLAKIERDNFKLKLEKVDVHALIEDILPGVQLKANELQGNISTELNAVNPVVEADLLHLSNILHNLLDNALKYHNGAPDIRIGTSTRGGHFVLSIKDNGIGIPEASRQRIFNKFYRVNTGDVHNVKGFGLGLFYVKNICDAHKWEIILTSEEGVGTEVRIRM